MSRIARTHRWTRWLPVVVPVGVMALSAIMPRAAHAQADVFGTFFNTGGVFSYNLSVQNLGQPTLALVSFVAAPGAGSVTNLSAPAGFQISFDSGNGFVDFSPTSPLTNGDFTFNRTVPNFRFTSTVALAGRPFTALDENGVETTGTLRITAAPEPGTLGFLAVAGLPLAALVSRRRRAATASLKG